jgi:hypothetical protein
MTKVRGRQLKIEFNLSAGKVSPERDRTPFLAWRPRQGGESVLGDRVRFYRIDGVRLFRLSIYEIIVTRPPDRRAVAIPHNLGSASTSVES